LFLYRLIHVDQVIASVDADQAAIDTAQTNLEYTSIVAPSDGHMGVRLIDPGNLVHASAAKPIAMLTLTKPSAVIFTLSARSLDDVREAMERGPVEVIAFSQDNKRQLAKGTLLLIDNIVDQASATMRLKAMFPNEHDELWPGDFVNARLFRQLISRRPRCQAPRSKTRPPLRCSLLFRTSARML
jgi:membrane fusion protein, multidrug efflux system